MAFEDPRTRLAHILDAAQWIERMIADRTLENYRQDRVLRDFIERNLERISEASRHLPESMKARFPGLPWRDIAALGNRLRHAYDSINDDIIWNIATQKLPALRAAVEKMLRESGGAGP